MDVRFPITRRDALEFAGGAFEPADAGGLGADHLPTREALAELRDSLRNGIVSLWKGDEWALERAIKYSIATLDNRVVKWGRHGTFRDLFTAAMFDVVQSEWE